MERVFYLTDDHILDLNELVPDPNVTLYLFYVKKRYFEIDELKNILAKLKGSRAAFLDTSQKSEITFKQLYYYNNWSYLRPGKLLLLSGNFGFFDEKEIIVEKAFFFDITDASVVTNVRCNLLASYGRISEEVLEKIAPYVRHFEVEHPFWLFLERTQIRFPVLESLGCSYFVCERFQANEVVLQWVERAPKLRFLKWSKHDSTNNNQGWHVEFRRFEPRVAKPTRGFKLEAVSRFFEQTLVKMRISAFLSMKGIFGKDVAKIICLMITAKDLPQFSIEQVVDAFSKSKGQLTFAEYEALQPKNDVIRDLNRQLEKAEADVGRFKNRRNKELYQEAVAKRNRIKSERDVQEGEMKKFATFKRQKR